LSPKVAKMVKIDERSWVTTILLQH